MKKHPICADIWGGVERYSGWRWCHIHGAEVPKKQERILSAWLMEALARRRPFRAKVRTWAPPSGTDLLRQQGAVEWSDILIPCPGIEPGYPGWESGIPARRLARARGWMLSFHGSLPPVKSAFITEAESVNAGTDFIIRNIAQVGEHRKKWFSWDRSKAEMQSWRERVWMSPPVSRSTVKSRSSHSYEAVLLDFAFLQVYHLVSFSTPDLPGTLPCIHTHIPQPRWISKWRLPWGARLIMVWHSPWLLTHKEPCFACPVSPLSQKVREWRSLYPLLKRGFSPLCPCHDGYI